MIKFKRVATWVVLGAMIFMLFTSCERSIKYHGPDVNLNTVVLNNIIGLYSLEDSGIAPMEQDDYGRKLFVYQGKSVAIPDPGLVAICICQKSDSKYAYYYPEDCFLLYQNNVNSNLRDDALVNKALELAPATDLESLKEKNDWGKPLDLTRCDKKPLIRSYKEDPVDKDSKLAFYSAVGYMNLPGANVWDFLYLTSDSYNRHIYYSQIKTDGYAVMFYPDGHFDYVKITDPLHYQDDMKAFKARNNWNEPIG